MEGSLYEGCRAHFRPCSKRLQVTIPNPFGGDVTIGSKSTEDRVSDICDPVRDRFRREVGQISTSLKSRAAAFAGSYRPSEIKLEPGEECDTRSSQNFIIDCKEALQKQDQDQDLKLSASCRVDGKKRAPAPSYLSACIDASFVGDSADLRPNLRARCTYPVETPQQSVLQVPLQQLQSPDGRCPWGTRPVGRYRCVRVAVDPPPQIVQPPFVRPPLPPTPPIPPPVGCPGDLLRTVQGGCACPAGTVLRGRDRCIRVAAPPPPPPAPSPPQPVPLVTCAGDLIRTAQGGCVCPAGTVQRGSDRCIRVVAPPPTCRGNLVPLPQGGCGCPPNLIQQGEQCVSRPTCRGNLVPLPQGGCGCPPNLIQQGERCVSRPTCRGNLVPLPQGGCGCPPNLIQQGERCVSRPTCRGNLVPLPQGGCGCPPNTMLQGERCVAGVRCPDGSRVAHIELCRRRCPDGKIVRLRQPCPGATQPKPAPCPLVKTCVQWGKGAPGSLFGPCIRYENRPQCPSNVK
jgi:hypothetical protein